jgi:hypothetical protein
MKRLNLLIVNLFVVALMASSAFAAGAWQIEIKASAANADNVVVIGQNPGALDGIDPIYDIPAMLSGDIEAYAELDGGQYWQSIMGTCASCAKTWDLSVTSHVQDAPVTLSWDSTKVPAGASMVLVDLSSGESVDMAASGSYQFENTGARLFRVESHVE